MIKVYTIGLKKMGLTKKTVFLNGNSYELIDGHKMRESAVTEAYPHYFYETGEFIEGEPTANVVEEVVVESTPVVETNSVEEGVVDAPAEETTPVVEEVVVEANGSVEDEESQEEAEASVEFIADEKPDLSSVTIRPYAEFKNKDELEIYAAGLGIDLNKSKSMRNMYKDLEAAFKVAKA